MMFGYQTTDTFWAAFRVGIRWWRFPDQALQRTNF